MLDVLYLDVLIHIGYQSKRIFSWSMWREKQNVKKEITHFNDSFPWFHESGYNFIISKYYSKLFCIDYLCYDHHYNAWSGFTDNWLFKDV